MAKESLQRAAIARTAVGKRSKNVRRHSLDRLHVSMIKQKTKAFLNPKIDRDNIYMEMPLGINWLASNGSTAGGSESNGSMLILRKAL